MSGVVNSRAISKAANTNCNERRKPGDGDLSEDVTIHNPPKDFQRWRGVGAVFCSFIVGADRVFVVEWW